MSKADSVKDRLKNLAKETGKTMNELLVAYGLERTIYRISVSKYADNFTLKGGILLYAMFGGDFVRATTDIDLEADLISNDVDEIRQVFEEIFAIDADDPLRFDMGTLNVKSITEFKKYHGVNVSIMAFLDRTKIAVSIDVGFGDVIYPERVRMDFPVLLSEQTPAIYAYSVSTCVAEKFEAIVSLGYDNSRFKDYYDLYILATEYDFEGAELTEAVRETFENRRTDLDEIVAFEDGFAEDPVRLSRWNAFVKKKKAILNISLQDTINLINEFMSPIVDHINGVADIPGTWSHTERKWEK